MQPVSCQDCCSSRSTFTPARLSYRQKLLFEGRVQSWQPGTLCWRCKLLPDRCGRRCVHSLPDAYAGASLSDVWRRKQLCWYKESYFVPAALIVVYLRCGRGAKASALHRALPQMSETKLNSCLTAARTQSSATSPAAFTEPQSCRNVFKMWL